MNEVIAVVRNRGKLIRERIDTDDILWYEFIGKHGTFRVNIHKTGEVFVTTDGHIAVLPSGSNSIEVRAVKGQE